MRVKETPKLFGNKSSLVGIISEPDAGVDRSLPGILLLNSGRVHHVGPNRIYVELARMLSNAGLVVLRFDFSGVGDSGDADGAIPFMTQAVADTKEAMNLLARERGLTSFGLLGICSGAMAAFDTCCSSPEVRQLVMVNFDPWRPFGSSSGDVHDRNVMRAYRRAIHDPRRWERVFTFKTRYRNVASAARHLFRRVLTRRANTKDEYATKLEELVRRDVQVLTVFGEQETGLDWLQLRVGHDLAGLRSKGGFDLKVLSDVDHTFTSVSMQRELIRLVYDWYLEHNERIVCPRNHSG